MMYNVYSCVDLWKKALFGCPLIEKNMKLVNYYTFMVAE